MSKNNLPEIVFRVTQQYYGWPEPFIEDGTLVIFVQDHEAKVTEYAAPTEEDPNPWFWDIENKDELIPEAERLVREGAPAALKVERATFFLCPEGCDAQRFRAFGADCRQAWRSDWRQFPVRQPRPAFPFGR